MHTRTTTRESRGGKQALRCAKYNKRKSGGRGITPHVNNHNNHNNSNSNSNSSSSSNNKSCSLIKQSTPKMKKRNKSNKQKKTEKNMEPENRKEQDGARKKQNRQNRLLKVARNCGLRKKEDKEKYNHNSKQEARQGQRNTRAHSTTKYLPNSKHHIYGIYSNILPNPPGPGPPPPPPPSARRFSIVPPACG